MPADDADRLLVARIRTGESTAWEECIARFEGRLIAYVDSRLKNRATSEDVVQETFIGFLVGLPNYDDRTPLETFLFSIAAHKLTDVLRRQGRRPTLPLVPASSQAGDAEPQANIRMASSLARSREKRNTEEHVLADSLKSLIRQWIERGEFERMKCMELLLVAGLPNKAVAEELGITEQTVANHKHFVLSKLKDRVRDSGIGEEGLTAMLGDEDRR